ncbi:hypothetical protein [Streptomyces syringium]|uniref:hypothetical protein n=1 Tax=Streptomyces syringium TaxID=76729 RepID=UPI003D8BE0A5
MAVFLDDALAAFFAEAFRVPAGDWLPVVVLSLSARSMEAWRAAMRSTTLGGAALASPT